MMSQLPQMDKSLDDFMALSVKTPGTARIKRPTESEDVIAEDYKTPKDFEKFIGGRLLIAIAINN